MRPWSLFVLWVVWLPAVWLPGRGHAHEFRPAVLSLSPLADGCFNVEWVPPRTVSGFADVRPVFPPHCAFDGEVLACGDAGLRGQLSFHGLAGSNVEVIVQVARADETTQTETLTGTRATLSLGAGQGPGGAPLQLAWAYMRLGVEHILAGADHLLFVLGLMLITGFGRTLLWTITAFTVAHSLTLASASLGWWTLPSAPVEACIALSILLVTHEALRGEPSWTHQRPQVVAFTFGLLHGFGFSGALAEIGLPAGQAPLALATFNLGVELGQLAVIALLFAGSTLARRLGEARHAAGRVGLVYAMGTAAAYWTLQRLEALVA